MEEVCHDDINDDVARDDFTYEYDGIDNDDYFDFDDVENDGNEYLMMMTAEMMIPMTRLVLDRREGSFFHCPSQKQELHVSPGLKTHAHISWF